MYNSTIHNHKDNNSTPPPLPSYFIFTAFPFYHPHPLSDPIILRFCPASKQQKLKRERERGVFLANTKIAIHSVVTGDKKKSGIIRKYGLNMSRQAFREKAQDIGFVKVRFFSSSFYL